MLPMAAWLLYLSNSATSILCVYIALAIFLIYRFFFGSANPRAILPFFVFLFFSAILAEYFFDVTNHIITWLGRRPDLTTRVPMWQDLLSMVKNPLVGTGFESFWLGERRNIMVDNWSIGGQAHNGYLDMYLNLGLAGLFFMLAWLLNGFRRLQNLMIFDPSTAILHFSFLVVIALYNWTEATFVGINNMILIFFFVYMSSNYALHKSENATIRDPQLSSAGDTAHTAT